jgi:hypothetical protein
MMKILFVAVAGLSLASPAMADNCVGRYISLHMNEAVPCIAKGSCLREGKTNVKPEIDALTAKANAQCLKRKP